MQNLQVKAIRKIFDALPCSAKSAEETQAPQGSEDGIYQRAAAILQQETAEQNYRWAPAGIFRDKIVLDLGCDTGGRSVASALTFGSAKICGVERSAAAIETARRLTRQHGVPHDFRVGSGEAIPFDSGSIDAIISNDVIEHVRSPEETLRECWRVLSPGGHVALRFPPFFHPFESHLGHVTNPLLPLHLVFSKRALRTAYCQTVVERHLGLPAELEPWEVLPTLNGITVRRFRRIVAAQGWDVVLWEPSSYFQRRLPALGKCFRFLASLPLLEEVLLHRICVVLRKPDQNDVARR